MAARSSCQNKAVGKHCNILTIAPEVVESEAKDSRHKIACEQKPHMVLILCKSLVVDAGEYDRPHAKYHHKPDAKFCGEKTA